MKKQKSPLMFPFYLALSSLILQLCLPVYGQTDKDRGTGVRPTTQTQEKRLALVIGNAAYTNAPTLMNPANDANDMTATLTSLGFEVLSGTNQNKRQMESLIRQFGDKLARQGGVGLFFYAGHGIQVRGSNYLVPVEADIPQEDEVDYAAVNLSFLMAKMDAAENNLNIIILDACRNNPFARKWRNFRDTSVDSGLAKVTPPTGTIMLYATQPGNVASDGAGRNGLFTESLLKQIRKPNVELDVMIKALARDVSDKSNKKQLPWKEGIVLGDFYFAGTTNATTVTNNNEPNITEKDAATREREAWDLVKNSADAEDFRFYLKEFPGGANVSRAKIRLEQLVWDSVKNSNNKTRVQGYLNEFPNGSNASSARILLRQLEAKETAATNTTPPNTTTNASNANKAGAVRKNSIGMELVYIPSGSFMMGSPETEKDRRKDEGPQRRVTIKEGFYMGRYEVTQAQYQAVMGLNPSNFKGCDNCPVETVSWNDAKEFIRKLNEKNDGFTYRLPSEAEWEYACRAGTTTAFSFGDSLSSLQANFNGNHPYGSGSKGEYKEKTTPVGSYQPNGFGLYDMHGNVWEWVEDIYNENGYADLPTDGSANMSAGDSRLRVLRGGGWTFGGGGNLRSASRTMSSSLDSRYLLHGFRVVASAKTQ